MAVAADREPLGRDHELLRLREFVSTLPDGPRSVTIRGEPGIGKTTVWRAGIARGRGACMLLSARCVEAELPLAFVGLSDLVADRFDDVAVELPDPDRSVLAGALGLAEAARPAPQALALPRAFLAFLRAVARAGPVLIAVDDVQWFDHSSARILAFAARRLRDLPVGILVTQRGDEPDPLDLRNALGAERYEELRLGPLSLGAVTHLVRTRSDVKLPRPVLARVHEASGGNPMFALEFARTVDPERPQPGPIAMPSSLLDLVRGRVERCPEDVRSVLAIVAATERPTTALLESVNPRAPDLLAAAVDLDAVAIGDDGVVRFTHPLLGSAAYGGLKPSARRSVHAELARACENAEERARHLALATAAPDPAVARLLDDAAAAAGARGGVDASAELALEALRLTASDDPQRFERTLAAASYLADAVRLADAHALLDRLLAGALEDPMRARALLLKAILADNVEEGLRLDELALAHMGESAAQRAEALMWLSSAQLYAGDLTASEATARQALDAAEAAGESSILAAALAGVAERADLAGRPEQDLFERAAALAEVHGLPSFWPSLRELTGRRRLRHGDLFGARDALEAELALALERDAVGDRYRLSRDLADVERHAGNIELSEQHLEDAEECLGVFGDRWGEAELAQRRTALAALRGRAAESRDLAARGRACADAIQWPHLASLNRWAVGSLELSLDHPAAAWHALEEITRVQTWGRLEALEAVADAIDALVGLGDLELADELLLTLEKHGDRGHRWAGPASLRCRALLMLARGSLESTLAAAEEAAAGFEQGGFRFHAGRSLLVAGEALRRAGERRRAAERLETARDLFTALGAERWRERCENELRTARPRPRRDSELTDAERRVAALVALGKRNREVAAQLFTTVSTVEAHLTRMYRKLGIRSRTELARLVADGALSLGED